VSIWITGSGAQLFGNAGLIATSASEYYCCAVSFNGSLAPVTYTGSVSGAVLGVAQINFQVPTVQLRSSLITVLGRDGSQSSPVTLYLGL
jgi:uncharacterized protein (TIGR03437 family)